MRRCPIRLITAALCMAALFVPAQPARAQPEIPETWYFAEGTTREGFFEYLSIQNCNDFFAHVDITYMTSEGEIGPFSHIVDPVSRETVCVNSYLDPGLDVSARVESDVGIVAERPMYFSYKGKWEGGHDAVGVTEAGSEWYFAEGTTRRNFEEWLCIQNPQDGEVDVKVFYYTSRAVQHKEYRIAALHRFTVDVNEEVAELWPEEPEQDVSLKVEASAGVIAERPMYFNYMDDWEGGSTVVGERLLGSQWYLAEGYCQWNFDTWLCFLNPNREEANVVVNYRRGDGALLPPQDLVVPGLSRRTVCVNSVVGFGEFSFQITSDREIVVERPMYFNYQHTWQGGHVNKAIREARGEWYLAEGATRKGFETYLCILNPLDSNQCVTVEYMMEKRGYRAVEFDVPARSRYTRNVNADVGEGHDVSFRVKAFLDTSPVQPGRIVVERPVYFLYGGTMAGGHVASGYPTP